MHPSKVFISYARENSAAATRLCRELAAMGVDPWLDQERLLPGQRWEREIKAALQASDFAILLLSSQLVQKRGYVQSEIRLALRILDEFPDNRVFLLPVRLDDCRPANDRLSELHWVDLFPSWSEGLGKLRSVFSRVPERIETSPPAVDLAGTFWIALQEPGGRWRFSFMPGGIFRYEDAAIDRYLDNGIWRLSGKSLYVQLNENYVQLTGNLLDDGSLIGEGASLGGWNFEWKAVRAETPHRWEPERA